jgi:ribosomal protein S15
MNKHLDPYRAAQAKQRRAANLLRQDALRKQKEASLGDPVWSQPTPFIQSLQPDAPLSSLQTNLVNHFVDKSEMQQTIEHSKWLTEPQSPNGDPIKDEAARREHQRLHENAVAAMELITALEIGSGKDRTRLNIQRCIEEFGRHNTDRQLPPKPPSTQALAHMSAQSDVPIRSGPDTGSSEVQIAVLTAKINVLATNLKNKDKHNKRNLRLLVHKRQKLLNYLRSKERGGPRWQNLVDKLGINNAMWQGEISLR